MKTLVQKMSLVWVLLVGLYLLPEPAQAQQAEVSFQVFYDELAPYGRWLIHPKYGDVWAPNVQGEFTPYLTNGYWTVTQYGNTWVSNYDWGWATFHYGRWHFDEFEGWVWVPDTVWAPAWVVWRNGGGYYGWAAMSPGYNFSVSFNLFNGIPSSYWCFVPQQYVWRPYVYRYCAPRYRNVYIVNNTTYVTHCTVNNTTYNYYTGPSHTEITHVTNRPVVIHSIEHSNRPGRTQVERDKISMYAPIVKRNNEMNKSAGALGTNDWYKSRKGSFQGGQSGDNNPGNNGHGDGDQSAPGNSGDHNNGENSDNGGLGNSGNGAGSNGSRWGSVSDRGNNNWNSNNVKRSESTNRSGEFKKSSGFSSNNNRSTGITHKPTTGSSNNSNRSYTPANSGSSGNNNRSLTPSRTGGSSGSKSFTPSHSGGSNGGNRSFTPSHSSSGGGNKSVTPSHSGGGSKTFTPSHSGGSKSKTKN